MRIQHFSLTALALAIAACQGPSTTPSDAANGADETNIAEAVDPVINAAEPPPVHLDPDAKPVAGDDTALGAARRVVEYCDALATKRYADAYAMWADGGKASGHTLAEFTKFYEGDTITDCVVGEPGEMQGAAGTIYIEIPNTFRGLDAKGKTLAIEGPVILKRVNNVDGSTPEQRRWHIARAEFPL